MGKMFARPSTNQHLHELTGKFKITCILPVLRSEEHTSELQSHLNIVCRLLLEKKKSARQLLFKPRGPRPVTRTISLSVSTSATISVIHASHLLPSTASEKCRSSQRPTDNSAS